MIWQRNISLTRKYLFVLFGLRIVQRKRDSMVNVNKLFTVLFQNYSLVFLSQLLKWQIFTRQYIFMPIQCLFYTIYRFNGSHVKCQMPSNRYSTQICFSSSFERISVFETHIFYESVTFKYLFSFLQGENCFLRNNFNI